MTWGRFIARSASFLRDARGASAVEFALLAPFMLLLMALVADMGRAWWQANQIERNLKAAGEYASRVTLDSGDLNDKDRIAVLNIARFGHAPEAVILNPGSTPLSLPTAQLSVRVEPRDIFLKTVNVVRVEASVPYAPLFPTLMRTVGMGDWRISAMHEDINISE